MQVIVDHFDKYPLISAKVVDYLLFKKCFNLIKLQEHLTEEGLLKLIGIKASLNLGLPLNLKEAFPKVEQYNRPAYTFKGIADPNWVAGFSSGDSSFSVKTGSSTTNKLGSRVQLRFEIGLNIREKELIKGLATFFKLGYSSASKVPEVKEINDKYVYITNDSVHLQVIKFEDILNIVIPFFEEYPIQGKKSSDLADFKKAAELIKNKEHLTLGGFNKILEIKAAMNKVRI